jgi:hypothetical protein
MTNYNSLMSGERSLPAHNDEAMSERPSYRWENKEFLLETIMKQIGIKEEDLERDPSWINAKLRESNIDKVLDSNN